MIHTKCIYIIFVLNYLFVVHIKSTIWTPTSTCILYNDYKSSLNLTSLNLKRFSDILSDNSIFLLQICGSSIIDCNGYSSHSCYFNTNTAIVTPFGLANETQEYNFTSTGIELTYSVSKHHVSCIKNLKVKLICDRTLPPGSIGSRGQIDDACNLVYTINSGYICMTCYNDCSGRGYCNEITGECICTNDQSTGIGCLESRLSISNVTNTTVLGGNIIIDGYFGTTSQNIVVLIGDLSCKNIIATQTNITCSVPPLNNFQNGLSKNVFVMDNGFNVTKVNGFTFQNLTCTQSCNINHSYCNGYTGICECDDQSYGDTCSISKLKIEKVLPSTVLGGESIIHGYFGTTNSIQVLLDNESCKIKMVSNISITFIAPPGEGVKNITIIDRGFNDTLINGFVYQYLNCKPSCHSIHGMCDIYKGVCECDTQSNGDLCQLSKISINSISASKFNDLYTLILYGYFGQITPQFNLTIGNILCNNITQYNYTTISCEIGYGYGTHNVTAQDNDLIFIGINLFTYPTINNNNKNKIIIVSVVVPVVVVSIVLISISIIYKRYHNNKSKSKNINNIKLGSSLSQISKDKLYL